MNHYIPASGPHISNELVILVHGLLHSSFTMQGLGKYLSGKGYDIYLYDYPSTQYHIKEHGQIFREFLQQLMLEHPGKKIHFIGHSLGGIIIREALANIAEKYLTRCSCLIMLAPPNHGSVIAKMCIKLLPVTAKLIQPLEELSSDPDTYIHHMPIPRHVNVGVVTGKFDAKVHYSTAHLQGEKDFLLVNSTHDFIMNHIAVKEAIVRFLKNNSFH